MILALLVEWVARHDGDHPAGQLAQWWADGVGAEFGWSHHTSGRAYIELDVPSVAGTLW
jgi:hypothetical protein